jgi:hypothetical protein
MGVRRADEREVQVPCEIGIVVDIVRELAQAAQQLVVLDAPD